MTTTTENRVSHHLEALSKLLVPKRRIYWVLASDEPPAELICACPPGGGYTGSGQDVVFRRWFESQGRWTGRGAAVVLDDRQVAVPRPGPFDWRAQEDLAVARHALFAIALHELAHVAVDVRHDVRDLRISKVAARSAVENLRRRVQAEAHSLADRHGPIWLRAAAHSWHRARIAGYRTEPELVFAPLYGEPTVSDAAAALYPELRKLERVPLDELQCWRPPSDFHDLWAQKMETWRAQQSADDHDADALVADYLRELL